MRNDDSGRRTTASRKPDHSESDSSETEYTRKSRQWDVKLTPHEQLEALDLWLKANPEVAREVEFRVASDADPARPTKSRMVTAKHAPPPVSAAALLLHTNNDGAVRPRRDSNPVGIG